VTAAIATRVRYEPFGSSRLAFARHDPELLLSGPAGTGKTRGLLEKVHLCASKYAGMRGVLLRKTHTDLVGSALVTYQRKVLHPLDGVSYFGGSAREPASFRYPNGSEILLGGMDRSQKIMSKEFDLAYVNEATELLEDDWESITTRLRNGVMPYQQLLADCNPGAPTHWLKQRADSGRSAMLESRHEDNPTLWDRAARTWTAFGTAYIAKLDALSGVRKLRLRLGIWAAAEGMIYDGWDRARHLVDRFDIPADWPRYWAVDFGYTNPFCWQAWAEDPDGRLFRYREVYLTHGLVEDHAETIRTATKGEPRPRAVICDHDAEDRATLERKLQVATRPAHKAVSPGIQAVAERLRTAGDGRPRLFLMRDSLLQRDAELDEARRPTCTEDEVESYVWDVADGRKKGDQPVKANDHGMDALRYMVAHRDLVGRTRSQSGLL
jgi:PBSX family phage terminase large subunit